MRDKDTHSAVIAAVIVAATSLTCMIGCEAKPAVAPRNNLQGPVIESFEPQSWSLVSNSVFLWKQDVDAATVAKVQRTSKEYDLRGEEILELGNRMQAIESDVSPLSIDLEAYRFALESADKDRISVDNKQKSLNVAMQSGDAKKIAAAQKLLDAAVKNRDDHLALVAEAKSKLSGAGLQDEADEWISKQTSKDALAQTNQDAINELGTLVELEIPTTVTFQLSREDGTFSGKIDALSLSVGAEPQVFSTELGNLESLTYEKRGGIFRFVLHGDAGFYFFKVSRIRYDSKDGAKYFQGPIELRVSRDATAPVIRRGVAKFCDKKL